ncbi:hypothetical protein LSH36_78g01019 [Paralvinella palmiformis]|uniref:Endonuclease/exonuclease/phosphatase domain-containing protein n=1 Tax=Paralvinella palmiformis TaxID=53620 RepID=A0AAD9K2W0_9ANNE|nr:hypothetical protein LSH36_78g01019 [Paralvinella palmiformis]
MINFASIYRSPGSGISVFMSFYGFLSSLSSPTLICGDFNIHLDTDTDPWAPDPYDPREIYGSHYGGPGYARSDYGTYPGPARNHIYEPGNYGSQSVYGGPAFSDYGIYGTYGHRPPPPRTDFIPASELGRPSTAMSTRLSTNV